MSTLSDWSSMQREKREARGFNEGDPQPHVPVSRCLGCFGDVFMGPRLVPDWRLGPEQQFDSATGEPHDCLVARKYWERAYR